MPGKGGKRNVNAKTHLVRFLGKSFSSQTDLLFSIYDIPRIAMIYLFIFGYISEHVRNDFEYPLFMIDVEG